MTTIVRIRHNWTGKQGVLLGYQKQWDNESEWYETECLWDDGTRTLELDTSITETN